MPRVAKDRRLKRKARLARKRAYAAADKRIADHFLQRVEELRERMHAFRRGVLVWEPVEPTC